MNDLQATAYLYNKAVFFYGRLKKYEENISRNRIQS